uniref:Uncharacterized protein n=1 Tax=Caenorhabditis japonica TaxID=281687 RepID=A0A8R1ITM3_CAEJA
MIEERNQQFWNAKQGNLRISISQTRGWCSAEDLVCASEKTPIIGPQKIYFELQFKIELSLFTYGDPRNLHTVDRLLIYDT